MGMLIRLDGYHEIKYPGQTKVVSAALQENTDLSKATGKPQSQIAWSSRCKGEEGGRLFVNKADRRFFCSSSFYNDGSQG